MSNYKTIKGKIIRIISKTTVIINLGFEHGINENTIFRILAEPEKIFDPETNEELGAVNVVKSKLKAQTVHDKFTIATTRWTESNLRGLISGFEIQKIDHGELNVNEKEIEPWKAVSEIPVKKGDEVEADILIESEKD